MQAEPTPVMLAALMTRQPLRPPPPRTPFQVPVEVAEPEPPAPHLEGDAFLASLVQLL